MAKPLKIALIVHHQLALGTGAPGSTLNLAAALRHRGHMVDVIGMEIVGPGDGVWSQVRFPWKVASFLRKAIADQAYDIVDASTGDLWLMSNKDVDNSSTVFVTRSHGLEQLAVAVRRGAARRGELKLRRRYRLYHGGWRLNEVQRSIGVADLRLVLNVTEKAYLTQIWGVKPATVVQTAPIAGVAFATSPRTSDRDYSLLVVGGAQWRKGIDDHVVVVTNLLRHDQDLRVTWLGLSESDLVQHIPDAKLRERIATIPSYGPQEFGAILDRHGILMSLSRFEGLSVVLLEAMSHGLAVVANAIPGAVDLLMGDAGLLVEPGDLPGATEAVLSLKDASRRDALGEAATERVQRFAPERVVDILIENYREAMAAKAASLHS